jgi:hypothetical protein
MITKEFWQMVHCWSSFPDIDNNFVIFCMYVKFDDLLAQASNTEAHNEFLFLKEIYGMIVIVLFQGP